MYIYKNVAFRPIERDDLETLRLLHNEQSTFLNLLNIDLVDESAQIDWWQNLHKHQNDKRYIIVNAATPKEIIGRLRIQNIEAQNRYCEVGLDIVSSQRGKGYGKLSYEMLLEFLFLHFNMNMVYLKVADFNPNAKNLYLKVGFNETGRLPKCYYRHGKYWDYIIMAITKDEYLLRAK
jgi:diamine N-acetyltransferase